MGHGWVNLKAFDKSLSRLYGIAGVVAFPVPVFGMSRFKRRKSVLLKALYRFIRIDYSRRSFANVAQSYSFRHVILRKDACIS